MKEESGAMSNNEIEQQANLDSEEVACVAAPNPVKELGEDDDMLPEKENVVVSLEGELFSES